MAKGGWAVLFEAEVSEPGEAVSDEEDHEEVGDIESKQDGPEELKQGEAGANEVQSSAGAVGMLGEVVGIKIVEIMEDLRHLWTGLLLWLNN